MTEETSQKLGTRIIPRIIQEEMKKSYLDYSMSVIVGRALPDVRDGLKPVHRRVLYTMWEIGLLHNKPFKKAANVVGNCMARFHPHSDAAIYDTLVRLAQDFSMRYLLVDGQGNFGCFTSDTKVKLTDGRDLSFAELVEEHKQGKRNFTFTIDEEGLIKIAEIQKPRLTKKNTEIMKVILDNDEEIKCTLNHKFMLKDGSYKEAKDLMPGDSLMPIYFRISTKLDDPNAIDYNMILQPNLQAWDFVHVLSDEWNISNEIYTKSAGRIRHHIDFNKLNNNPDNIRRIGWKEHWKLHYELTSQKHKTDMVYVKKLADGRKAYWSNVENRKKHSEILSIRNKKNWKKQSYRNYMTKKLSEINKEYIKNHPEKISELSQRATNTLKKLWQNESYRKKKSSHLKERWKNNDLSLNKFNSESSKKIWANPEHRDFISKKMKELWKNEDYKRKKSEFSKKLWQDENYKNFMIQAYKNKWNKDPKFREYFIPILTENGRKHHHNKFLKICQKIIDSNIELNAKNYEIERNNRGRQRIIGYEKALKKFFDNEESKIFEALEQRKAKLNHKVLRIEFLNQFKDVYDLTINKTHNFALSAGIFVHNSIDGDPAAAMRYTECRLTKLAEEMLEDIEKRTVRFIPNFDNSTTEPIVLPSKLPNLLINGSSGIAVGMATNIPPHNIGEVIDAIIKKVDNPDLSVEETLQIIQGPDFPTGALICGRNGIKEVYSTGRGKILVRAKTKIEQDKNKTVIIVNEIPFMVNKSELLEEIADLARDKKIIGISDLRDESDRHGIRIMIELRKDADANVVLNQLFQHTRMQTTFGVIMLALVNNEPKILNIKQLIQHFIEHRKDVVRKRTLFDLNKAQTRAHILEGLIIALTNINNVIRLIKESKSVETAKETLISNYNLTNEQAVAILDMRLQRLTSLEQEKIKQEHSDLLRLIEELKSILSNPQKILDIIKKELQELKEKYNDERRTQITEIENVELETEDLIKEEEMAITITNSGYIKRIPLQTYKLQHRGGKGIIATTTRDEDIVKDIFVASTHSYILFFTNKGKVHWLKVYNIPEASRQARGKAIVNLLELATNEIITAFVPVRNFDAEHYLIMATKKGIIKKTELIAYSNPRRHGIIAITLEQGDELINVELTDGNQQIILATKNGLAVKFKEMDVRPTGRSAQGVRGINLRDNDELIGMVVASDEKTLLTVTENGYGKRTPISEYRLINRGGTGVINVQCSERNGKVVSICTVTDSDDILFVSKNGIIIRVPASDISVIGRNTQGVRIMKLEANDKIVSAVKVANDNNK